ncbi:MAG: tetratricopeptide repeat protein [bacterium]
MLKPKKRLTKRKIKEDKFVTYYFKANDFVKQNSSRITMAGVGLLAVIVVGLVLANSRREKEKQASVEFAKARSEYVTANYNQAIKLLNDLIVNYGSTDKATVAKFYLANAYFNVRKYDEAEEFFEEYLDSGSDEFLKSSALAGVAACLEQKGEYARAADKYREAAEKYRKSSLSPQNLFDAARCYQLAGDTSAASKSLELLLEKFPSAGIKSDAEELLAELNP